MKNIKIIPNNNLYLLYSLLNVNSEFNVDDSIYSHFLRWKTYNHFKKYNGIKVSPELKGLDYSWFVSYVLTLKKDKLKQKTKLILNENYKNKVEKSKEILKHMLHFASHTDFDKFYISEILPSYNEICIFLKDIVIKSNIEQIINDAWNTNSREFPMIIIPMPLEGIKSGIGPYINNISYQIVGPPFNYSILHNIAHEGSHPRVKKYLDKYNNEINNLTFNQFYDTANDLIKKLYCNKMSIFEEHLIRANQIAKIDSKLFKIMYPIMDTYNASQFLAYEESEKSMVYIRIFYDELLKENNIDHAIKNIINKMKLLKY